MILYIKICVILSFAGLFVLAAAAFYGTAIEQNIKSGKELSKIDKFLYERIVKILAVSLICFFGFIALACMFTFLEIL